MADKKTVLVNGGNGGKLVPEAATVPDELERARDIARRYRCEFIDLSDFQLHHDLFEKIPVHLMFRYKFVPLLETPPAPPKSEIDFHVKEDSVPYRVERKPARS